MYRSVSANASLVLFACIAKSHLGQSVLGLESYLAPGQAMLRGCAHSNTTLNDQHSQP